MLKQAVNDEDQVELNTRAGCSRSITHSSRHTAYDTLAVDHGLFPSLYSCVVSPSFLSACCNKCIPYPFKGHIRQTGLKEWWRAMQYIGDAKAGTLVGKDQFVLDPFGNYLSITQRCSLIDSEIDTLKT